MIPRFVLWLFRRCNHRWVNLYAEMRGRGTVVLQTCDKCGAVRKRVL